MKNILLNHSRLSPRTRPFLTTTLGFLAILLVGCPGKKPEAVAPPAAAPNKIVIKGSHTIGEELAPRLIAEYKKEHPDISFELESKGTGTGIARLLRGECDIAGASRTPIKEETGQAEQAGIQFNDYVLGSYSVAVIVNSQNPLTNLTKEQVRDVFTGVVQNWKDIGGPDAPVHLYIRDPISGTYLGFRELALENKPYATNSTTQFKSYAEISDAIAKDPNGIGYTSLQVSSSSGARPISISSISPTAAAVNDGKYPYARTIRFYTNKEKEAPAAIAFIQFVESAKGQQILDQVGFTPHR